MCQPIDRLSNVFGKRRGTRRCLLARVGGPTGRQGSVSNFPRSFHRRLAPNASWKMVGIFRLKPIGSTVSGRKILEKNPRPNGFLPNGNVAAVAVADHALCRPLRVNAGTLISREIVEKKI